MLLYLLLVTEEGETIPVATITRNPDSLIQKASKAKAQKLHYHLAGKADLHSMKNDSVL